MLGRKAQDVQAVLAEWVQDSEGRWRRKLRGWEGEEEIQSMVR